MTSQKHCITHNIQYISEHFVRTCVLFIYNPHSHDTIVVDIIVSQTAKSFVMLRVLNDIKRELAEQRQAARERLEDSNNQDKTSLSQVGLYYFF